MVVGHPWRYVWSGNVWRNLSSRLLILFILLSSSKPLPIPGCQSSTGSLLKRLIPLILRVFSLIVLKFCVACGTVLGTTHLMSFLSLLYTHTFLRSSLKLGAGHEVSSIHLLYSTFLVFSQDNIN